MIVLLVEPDMLMAQLVIDQLRANHVTVAWQRSAQTAIDWLDDPDRRCDLVIAELTLGGHNGVEFIHELRSHTDWDSLPVVLHTQISLPLELMEPGMLDDYGIVKVIRKSATSVATLIDELPSLVEA